MIQIKKNKNQKIADKFMSSSSNQEHAESLVKDRIDMAADSGWTRNQTVDMLRKKGYLKTEMDRKIVNSVLQKKGKNLRDDSFARFEDKDREKRAVFARRAKQEFINQSREPVDASDIKDFDLDPKAVLRK